MADAVIGAIQDRHSEVVVLDRGAYRRVLVPKCCVVTRSALEACLGRSVHFPGDLEKVMLAFKGRFAVCEDQAIWTVQDDASRGLDQG
jgi:hypothetical protein